MGLPLEGVIVLEFSQYLSGPCAGLRLADLGARVIKIEHPEKGEAGRKLAIKNLWVDNSSLLFHTINRNKESFAADLNNGEHMEWVRKLIARADVLVHNFRPGVMERRGLGYEALKNLHPSLVYTQISGYGETGPWKNKPGQDLLVQSLSGLAYTTGSFNDAPTPVGLGIGDYLCGNQAVQFILAALLKARKTGRGTLLQLSLMESLVDFQFEFFTTYFQSGKVPERAQFNNANALLSAPYGIYKTLDGYLAVAMMPIAALNRALQCPQLEAYAEEDAFAERDEIKRVIAGRLMENTNGYWLERTEALDLWVMPVLNWEQMRATGGYRELGMEQEIVLANNQRFTTTRCPVRINGALLTCAKPAPAIGEDNDSIKNFLA
jgi:crotonobetainyl-CoA:carnitine CoA-transferase CaiB-like acyl-CoA transferase